MNADQAAIVKWLQAVTKNGGKNVSLSRTMALRIIELLERTT